MLFGLNEATSTAKAAVATNLFNENFDFFAMEHEMIAESHKAWNKIEIMITEANCRLIHENAVNPEGFSALMENAITGFFGKVKEFFIKLKNMVVELFQKFMMWLNSKMKSEKEFATKYEKEIMAKITSLGEIDVKGFKYAHLDEEIKSVPAHASLNVAGADADARKDALDKQVNEFRASLCGETGEVEAGDFSNSLYEYYRSGEKEPEDITVKFADVKAIFSELKSFSTSKAAVEKSKSKIEKELNAVVKELEKLEKAEKGETEESQTNIANIQLKIGAIKEMHSARNQAFTAKIAAIKERAEYGKKVILSIKSAKKSNESATELGGLFGMSI